MTDYIELGNRLVACKGFRWMPGMLVNNGARIVTVNEDTSLRFLGFYPDLSDAATKGCVIHLVRELWPKEKWKQLGRSHSEIVKKLTWLSGPESEAEVLVSLIGLAGEDKE